MKKLIIYQSKTGFARRYAKWIQEAVKGDLVSVKNINEEMLKRYDIVIFGSYIRIERVRGLKKVWNMVKENPRQNCIFFATGAMDPGKKEHIQKIWSKSISQEVLGKVPHYYMQSGINFEKLSIMEKFLIKIFVFIRNLNGKSKKKSRDGMSFDKSSRNYIEPLVNCVKGLEASRKM